MLSLGFAFLQTIQAALAAVFGSVSAIIMAALLAFEVSRLNRNIKAGKSVTAIAMIVGLAPRLVLVFVLFWIGLQLLELKPLPMVVGFALTYFIGYLLNYTSGIKS